LKEETKGQRGSYNLKEGAGSIRYEAQGTKAEKKSNTERRKGIAGGNEAAQPPDEREGKIINRGELESFGLPTKKQKKRRGWGQRKFKDVKIHGKGKIANKGPKGAKGSTPLYQRWVVIKII